MPHTNLFFAFFLDFKKIYQPIVVILLLDFVETKSEKKVSKSMHSFSITLPVFMITDRKVSESV